MAKTFAQASYSVYKKQLHEMDLGAHYRSKESDRQIVQLIVSNSVGDGAELLHQKIKSGKISASDLHDILADVIYRIEYKKQIR